MNHSAQKALLLLMAVLSIYFYYIYYPIHSVVKNHFFIYLIIISFVYGWYKMYQSFLWENRICVSAKTLIFIFLVHFLALSCFFFGIIWSETTLWIILFFKVVSYLLFISFFWLICYSFWRSILFRMRDYINLDHPFLKIMVSGALGFALFIILLFVLAAFGLYNLYWVLVLLGLYVAFSLQEIKNIFTHISKPLKMYSLKDPRGSISLVIDELQYLVITFLLSVNFISVFRPFPIWWDDLWVYMNFPKLLSGGWELISVGQMYFWQLYTWIWFLFWSQTFAFLLNSFSWVIVSIVIYLAVKTIIPQNKTNYDFGLLAVIITLMMPMAVFQLAKDMKLDFGLLSISIIAFVLLLYTLFWKEKFSHKKSIWSLTCVWFFIGIAFSIKLTSLLLLIAALGLLFYKKLNLLWFFGFFMIFIWIFTWIDLWKMMNVLVPDTTWVIKNTFSILLIIFGCGFLYLAKLRDKRSSKWFRNLAVEIWCIMIGFILALMPWGIKHIWELDVSQWEVSIGSLIWWKWEYYQPDYNLIYSQEELKSINDQRLSLVSQTWTTTNEDFGRYFWYEQGINNYLKLPWNLTFQTNQKGEFTDITFIFFALIPLIFVILPYRKEIYRWPIIIFCLIFLLYYIPSPISSVLTGVFNQIFIPVWYVVILSCFLLPLVYFYYTLDRSNSYTKIFLANYVFSVLYVFLWTISAFWIVWYGILMYFVFILMILLSLISLEEDTVDSHYYHVSYIVLGIVSVYLLQSAIPHWINNIKSAGYSDYKVGRMSEEVALMTFHPEYFPIIFETNIKEDKRDDIFKEYRNKLLRILDGTNYYDPLLPQIQSISDMGWLDRVITELSRISLESAWKDNALKELRQDLYKWVIYPEKDLKNDVFIYRVWTFMKYFISDNMSRLLEDSLLTNFQEYIYNDDTNISYERMKTLGLEYLLIDLNAATIDKDPAKKLTQRYENLLSIFTHPKITLVETDSICLKIALSSYSIDWNEETYLALAGVNYNWKYTSVQKRELCVKTIMEILRDDSKLASFLELRAYKTAIMNAEIDINDDRALATAIVKLMQWNWYKALFRLD